MEKKTNTYDRIPKSALKNLNRNFLADPIRDENTIDSIMSEFINGDLETINSRLNSTEILKFKDQNHQTLIHAILRNEQNISEESKLEIIKKLVSDKNVSLHAMTNYNQNPLHLACQKGYGLIISYLIDNGSEQTLIDNYGNTPIHYLVDKFIRDCDDNDFYSQSNKQMKLSKTSEFDRINQILKNQSLLTLYNLLSKKTIGDNEYYYEKMGQVGYKMMEGLKKFISNKVQGSIPDIYKLIENKTDEINKIFFEFADSEENKIEKAKKIILEMNNDIFQIYNLDLEFSNVIWNNFLTEQNLSIGKKKKEIRKNLIDKIEYTKQYIQSNIINKINEEFIEKIYIPMSKFTAGLIFYDNFVKNILFFQQAGQNFFVLSNDKKGIIDYVKDKTGNQINLKITGQQAYDEVYKKLDNIKTTFVSDNQKIFLNGFNNVNNLDDINIYDGNFDINKSYYFNYNNNYHDNYINFCALYTKNSMDLYIPSNLDYNIKTNYHQKLKTELDEKLNMVYPMSETEIQKNIINNDEYLKYLAVPVLKNVIDEITNIICERLDKLTEKDEDKFIKSIEKFCMFDIKYLSEFIFKIINNLVIMEKYIADIQITKIKEANEKIKKIQEELKSKHGEDFKIVFKHFDYFINEITIKDDFYENYETDRSETFDTLYDKSTDVLDKLSEFVKDINEYFSLDQLEKYNQLLNESISTDVITPSNIQNSIFNNYSFNVKYPSRYKEYKNEFFEIKKEINLYKLGASRIKSTLVDNNIFLQNPNYKVDLINQMWNYTNTYNFNTFYLDKTNFDISDAHYLRVFTVKETNIAGNEAKIKKIKRKKFNYDLNYYKNISGEFKFSRGYDVLMYDISGNLNNLKDISGNLIGGKDEKKELCDMDFIKNISDYNSSENSVKENSNLIVSWMIEDDLIFNDVGEANTYIITNNLKELVNMIVYAIYEKVSMVSDIFFNNDKLQIINANGSGEVIDDEDDIGINLDNIEMDKNTVINIKNTLDIIQANPEQKKKYLYDNIKSFVKIIVYEEINKEVFKIMNEVKIKKMSPDKTNIESTQILSSDKIKEFNKSLFDFNSKYKNDYWLEKLADYIRDMPSSSTLEMIEIINLTDGENSKNGTGTGSNLTQTKIIDNKCFNVNKTNDLMKIANINYRVEDINGNTILIRLIEQYNVGGIKKIIEKKPELFEILSTYKNTNNDTPINFLIKQLKNIQTEYTKQSISERIEIYSNSLEKELRTNKEFNGIEISNTLNLVSESILNSIYLFNEIMWLQIYSYPTGWTSEDKKYLKNQILKIDKEELLINSFDSVDLDNYNKNIKNNSSVKVSNYINELEKEIVDLENEYNGLKQETENEFIKSTDYDISGKIDKIKKEIEERKNTIEGLKKISYDINTNTVDDGGIMIILEKYKKKLLDIKNLSINWEEYTKLVNELDDKYLKIIKILNNKCSISQLVSNYLLNVYSLDITNKTHFELINKYFQLIYKPTFDNYWDLDRYDDSDYNILNKSIIKILKTNIVGIVKNELLNTLANYISQFDTNTLINIKKDIINDVRSDNGLKESVDKYLYYSLIYKLKLANPDKANLQINIDEQKTVIINTLNKKVEGKLDKVEKDEIGKIIDFNKSVCENVGTNCYNEITKILLDGKKISIYYEIYNLMK